MRGLTFRGDRQVALLELPEPTPGPGEVLIQVARAAICGTDLHKYRMPPGAAHELAPGVPIIAGHEPAGWVLRAGPGAEHVRRGERVLVAGVIGCGRCTACQAGYNTACAAGPHGLHWRHHGGDADYVVVPAANALALPAEISLDQAAVLACAGGTALTGLRECGAAAGMRVAVVGLGPVGSCAVLLARALGCHVSGFDPNPERRRLALELGAAEAAEPSNAGSTSHDVVLECAGTAAAQRLSIDLVGRRGSVGLSGLGREALSLDLGAALIDNCGARVIGIAATPIKYFHELLAITARCRLPFERLVTHRFPLERAQEAFELVESGRAGKVLFEVAENLAPQ